MKAFTHLSQRQITDIDEKTYKLARVINKGWADRLKAQQNAQAAGTSVSNIESQSKEILDLRDDVDNLKKEVRRLTNLLKEKNEGTIVNKDIPQTQESIGEISSSERS